MFNIPVVLFIFKRKDTVYRIIERLAEIKPQKIYLISDGPRSEEEKKIVQDVRNSVESYINWECEIIKNYADHNVGVYDRIGKGAKWVFSKEEKAIFLEDDNLPEPTFFEYCKELLEKYEQNKKILWICGTNYLEDYNPMDESSYVFTQHLLPCGWASWSDKFIKYYDGDLKSLNTSVSIDSLSNKYENKSLYRQDVDVILKTHNLLRNNPQKASWDRQMIFSLKANDMFGISPSKNQIKNIGVDIHSTHGGTSYKKVMTRRFCGMDSIPLKLPLKHPSKIIIDKVYEDKVGKIILYPWYMRIGTKIGKIIKPIIGVKKDESLSLVLKKKLGSR